MQSWLFIILLCIFSFNCIAQEKSSVKPKTSKFFIDTTSKFINKTDVSAWLGYSEKELDTTLNLRLETISEKEFKKYKSSYISKLDTSLSRIEKTDTSFILKTQGKPVTFQADTTDYSHFSYYLGFLWSLNLYVISDIDGDNEVGDLLLVDSKSGRFYVAGSPFDYPCETVLISPNNKYMLAYANNYYEDNESYIKVLKINAKKDTYTLDLFTESLIERWQILDIVWINDESLALHVKETKDNYPETGESLTEEPIEEQYYLKAFLSK